ncbi:hypothetical protein BLOT_008422 [Blomia tropicalis]|nr:hypothetical protein BLOT_008422 [Blomia tropicalis]
MINHFACVKDARFSDCSNFFRLPVGRITRFMVQVASFDQSVDSSGVGYQLAIDYAAHQK